MICQQIANPTFYVVQTGSLVREAYNTGLFDVSSVGEMHCALNECGVKLKEHNADYLDDNQLFLRKSIVDAVNIAPQLGVIQTNYVLSQALIYGVDTQPFVDEVIQGNRWRKWVDSSHISAVGNDKWFATNPQRLLFTLVAGHYHFNGSAYQRLADEVSRNLNLQEGIISEVTKVIEHYLFTLE